MSTYIIPAQGLQPGLYTEAAKAALLKADYYINEFEIGAYAKAFILWLFGTGIAFFVLESLPQTSHYSLSAVAGNAAAALLLPAIVVCRLLRKAAYKHLENIFQQHADFWSELNDVKVGAHERVLVCWNHQRYVDRLKVLHYARKLRPGT